MRNRLFVVGIALLGCGPVRGSVREEQPARGEIRVWTARAIATVLAQVGPEFERTSGFRLRVVSDLPAGVSGHLSCLSAGSDPKTALEAD